MRLFRSAEHRRKCSSSTSNSARAAWGFPGISIPSPAGVRDFQHRRWVSTRSWALGIEREVFWCWQLE